MTDTDGLLNDEGLARFISDTGDPVYYLAGPPAMEQAMKALLSRRGIAAGDMRSEEFFGH